MAKVLVNESSLSGIADAIRGKNGSTDTYMPNEMAAAITAIETGGTTDTNTIKGIIDRSITSLVIPDGVTTIGNSALGYCKSLTSVTLPDGVTTIGKFAFCWCNSLPSINLPNSLTSIDTSAFMYCTKLASVKLPEGLTTIGDSAFEKSGLTSITVPSSVTTIKYNAFGSCDLISVKFKGTPTSIHSTAFNGCTNLTTINVPWAEGEVANAPWGATNATINYNYTE